jgi:hypothetical protein
MDEAELLKHHEILDNILGFVSESERDHEYFGEIRKQLNLTVSDDLMIVLINYMIDRVVVDPIKHSGFRDGEDFLMVVKNRKTSLFIESGGFKSVFKHRQSELKRLRDNQIIEDEKLRHDALISEWMVKTKWWPHKIALASFIVSLIALAWSIWK